LPAPAKAPYVQPVPQYQLIGNYPINGSCTSNSPLTQAWIGFGPQKITMDDCMKRCDEQKTIQATNPGGKGCSAISFVPEWGHQGKCTMHFGINGADYSCTTNW
jgi:hypothetical protein